MGQVMIILNLSKEMPNVKSYVEAACVVASKNILNHFVFNINKRYFYFLCCFLHFHLLLSQSDKPTKDPVRP